MRTFQTGCQACIQTLRWFCRGEVADQNLRRKQQRVNPTMKIGRSARFLLRSNEVRCVGQTPQNTLVRAKIRNYRHLPCTIVLEYFEINNNWAANSTSAVASLRAHGFWLKHRAYSVLPGKPLVYSVQIQDTRDDLHSPQRSLEKHIPKTREKTKSKILNADRFHHGTNLGNPKFQDGRNDTKESKQSTSYNKQFWI